MNHRLVDPIFNRKAAASIGLLHRLGVGVAHVPFTGHYGITKDGDVWRLVRSSGRSNSKLVPHKVTGTSFDTKGYLQVCLQRADGERGSSTVKVHRMVAEAWIGPRPDRMQVNHRDGDKSNPSLANLEYVTPSENVRHAIAMGLYDPSLVGRSRKYVGRKITLDDATTIRRRVASGESRKHMAREYGIHVMTVGEIVRGEIW